MIISNNVLPQIEPFHVYRHLLEENVCLCLRFSAIIFVLGSPGPQTAAVFEGPLRTNVVEVPPMPMPRGSELNFTEHMGGEHAYKKGRTEPSE